jgi:transcriptional regulator with PAS, ATPase and Fis domain
MAVEADSSFTLTTHEEGASARLPALRAVLTAPGRPPVAAALGIQGLVVGTSRECDLTAVDSRMSRRHCELRLTERGVWLKDLGSKNGTFVAEVPIVEAYLPPHVQAKVGTSTLVVTPETGTIVLPLSTEGAFGDAVGQSTPMRALFALLERAAPTDETILLLGESGTGKEVLARAIHDRSPRRGGPFVVVDCGALAASLVESELFGHARGAATGLTGERAGLLEEANGGTVFIDELGELPLDLQPKLLRAIENRQVRRLGSNSPKPFDARIVAATHRNLRAKTRDGSFRPDLYFRLAVVEAHVPALRERKGDIPLLVERFLAARRPPASAADLPPHALALLLAHDWPGNVRELRNTVSRLLLFPELLPETLTDPADGAGAGQGPSGEAALLAMPLPEARELLMERFEKRYVEQRMKQHGDNITRAAESMGVSRQLLHRLLDRYDLRSK